MEKKKEKTKISTVLLWLFLTIFLFLGGAIYALPNYLIVATDEFDLTGEQVKVIKTKDKNLKLPDFSVLQGDKFNVLERGYWHKFNKDDFEIGNDRPFDRIVTEDQESDDIK